MSTSLKELYREDPSEWSSTSTICVHRRREWWLKSQSIITTEHPKQGTSPGQKLKTPQMPRIPQPKKHQMRKIPELKPRPMQQVQSTGDGRNLNLRIEQAEGFNGVELVAVWTAMTILDNDYSSVDSQQQQVVVARLSALLRMHFAPSCNALMVCTVRRFFQHRQLCLGIAQTPTLVHNTGMHAHGEQ